MCQMALKITQFSLCQKFLMLKQRTAPRKSLWSQSCSRDSSAKERTKRQHRSQSASLNSTKHPKPCWKGQSRRPGKRQWLEDPTVTTAIHIRISSWRWKVWKWLLSKLTKAEIPTPEERSYCPMPLPETPFPTTTFASFQRMPSEWINLWTSTLEVDFYKYQPEKTNR